MAGVEVQANIVDALLHGGLRSDGSRGAAMLFATTALVALWLAFLLLSPRGNLIAVAVLMIAVVAASALMLVAGG